MILRALLTVRTGRNWRDALISMALLMLSLAACSSLTVPTPTLHAKPSPTAGWQNAWLAKNSCSSPCFEGVTPGVTTEEQAITIWQQSPLLNSDSLVSFTNSIGPNISGTLGSTIGFDWLDNSDPGGVEAVVRKGYPGKIMAIRVFFKHPFTLGSVIRAYGEPSHAVTIAAKDIVGESVYNIATIYMPQGFAIVSPLGPPQSMPKPKLNLDTEFDTIIFFERNEVGIAALTYYEPFVQFLKPWQGTRDFDFYCSGELCHSQ